MTVLVTGASGFYGCRLIPRLVKLGFTVKTYGRSPDAAPALADMPITHVCGDIADTAALARAMSDCQQLFHLAGLVSYRRRDYHRLYEINVAGTRKVMEAALAAGVERIVHLGSVAGMGIPGAGSIGTEDIEYNLRGLGLHYCDTKYEGEQEVHRLAARGLPVIILNPGITFGEGDTHRHHHTIFRSLSRGVMLGYPRGGVTFSDIDDVVAAAINALTMGRAGERYVIGSANLTYREASRTVSKIIGSRSPMFPIPGWLSETAGAACESILPLFGAEPPVSWQIAWLSQRRIFFSSDKAISELGLKQTPFEETINRTAPYYLAQR